jgi:hypothetical protein
MNAGGYEDHRAGDREGGGLSQGSGYGDATSSVGPSPPRRPKMEKSPFSSELARRHAKLFLQSTTFGQLIKSAVRIDEIARAFETMIERNERVIHYDFRRPEVREREEEADKIAMNKLSAKLAKMKFAIDAEGMANYVRFMDAEVDSLDVALPRNANKRFTIESQLALERRRLGSTRKGVAEVYWSAALHPEISLRLLEALRVVVGIPILGQSARYDLLEANRGLGLVAFHSLGDGEVLVLLCDNVQETQFIEKALKNVTTLCTNSMVKKVALGLSVDVTLEPSRERACLSGRADHEETKRNIARVRLGLEHAANVIGAGGDISTLSSSHVLKDKNPVEYVQHAFSNSSYRTKSGAPARRSMGLGELGDSAGLSLVAGSPDSGNQVARSMVTSLAVLEELKYPANRLVVMGGDHATYKVLRETLRHLLSLCFPKLYGYDEIKILERVGDEELRKVSAMYLPGSGRGISRSTLPPQVSVSNSVLLPVDFYKSDREDVIKFLLYFNCVERKELAGLSDDDLRAIAARATLAGQRAQDLNAARGVVLIPAIAGERTELTINQWGAPDLLALLFLLRREVAEYATFSVGKLRDHARCAFHAARQTVLALVRHDIKGVPRYGGYLQNTLLIIDVWHAAQDVLKFVFVGGAESEKVASSTSGKSVTLGFLYKLLNQNVLKNPSNPSIFVKNAGFEVLYKIVFSTLVAWWRVRGAVLASPAGKAAARVFDECRAGREQQTSTSSSKAAAGAPAGDDVDVEVEANPDEEDDDDDVMIPADTNYLTQDNTSFARLIFTFENQLVDVVLLFPTLAYGDPDAIERALFKLAVTLASFRRPNYAKSMCCFLLDLQQLKATNAACYTSVLQNLAPLSPVAMEFFNAFVAASLRKAPASAAYMNRFVQLFHFMKLGRTFIDEYMGSKESKEREEEEEEEGVGDKDGLLGEETCCYRIKMSERVLRDLESRYIGPIEKVLKEALLGPSPKVPLISEDIIGGYLDFDRYLAAASSDRFPEQTSRSDGHVYAPTTKGVYYVRRNGAWSGVHCLANVGARGTPKSIFEDWFRDHRLPFHALLEGIDMAKLGEHMRRTRESEEMAL